MTDLIDPPEPPEPGQAGIRAKDLVGVLCILRPTGRGEWPEKDGKKAQPYVECDVWTFDRAGVTGTGTGCRIAWWRAVAQLDGLQGSFVPCRPTQQEDNSIVLARLNSEAREVAARIVGEIAGGSHTPSDDGFGTEPF